MICPGEKYPGAECDFRGCVCACCCCCCCCIAISESGAFGSLIPPSCGGEADAESRPNGKVEILGELYCEPFKCIVVRLCDDVLGRLNTVTFGELYEDPFGELYEVGGAEPAE